jgi:hypothetical protein
MNFISVDFPESSLAPNPVTTVIGDFSLLQPLAKFEIGPEVSGTVSWNIHSKVFEWASGIFE